MIIIVLYDYVLWFRMLYCKNILSLKIYPFKKK